MHRHSLLFSRLLSTCLKLKGMTHSIEFKQLKQTAHHASSPPKDLSPLIQQPNHILSLQEDYDSCIPAEQQTISRPHPGAPIPLLASPARQRRDRRGDVVLLCLPAPECPDALHRAVPFQTSNVCAVRRDPLSWLSDKQGFVPAAVGLACAACAGG